MKTFKLMAFTWTLDKESHVRVRRYVTVEQGLTWMNAKKLRMELRDVYIVKEITK